MYNAAILKIKLQMKRCKTVSDSYSIL
uniref:Uncharacterized protein n=1 Tax=Anguilla anguilla TaxID=7936 RepID=A0A0E9P8T3_ANGAN